MSTPTQTANAARHQMRQWATDYAAALSDAADSVPGLLCRIPPGQSLPSLQWEGDARGAYWASAGLVDNLAQVTVRLHYLRESAAEDGPFERDEYPLSTRDIGTCDPKLAAALMVAAAQYHRTSLFDDTEK
ncbi:hypothetical protein [Streptomyces sp. NPDC059916]|uniref:hypothetical protein n=1 Tax=Streptomyces sp. NPDC059916 TaxID=3347001 RepID=UPI0036BB73AA